MNYNINLLYLLLGVKSFSHTLCIYCLCFLVPPSTKSVELPYAVKAKPPIPYSTIEFSVFCNVLQVMEIS